MLLDAQQRLSNSQALTATAYSTNAYDNVSTSSKAGTANQCVAFFVKVAADATTGDETYTFNAITSANANLSSETVLASRAIARATLVAGYRFMVPFPTDADFSRYIGASYTLGGTTPSITVSAYIMSVDDFTVWKAYPDAITIS